MGWMTTVTILNDCMDQVQKNPEQFVRGILDNSYDGGNVVVGNCGNYVTVMPSHHADDFRLYSAFQNSTTDMSKYNKKLIESCREHEYVREHILSNINRARRILSDLEDELLTMVD